MADRIYLASRSPRRRELLQQIGVSFDPLLFRTESRADPETGEDPLPGEHPDDYVRRVAEAKARHGVCLIERRQLPPRLVLSADTTLDIDGIIIGKPRDPEDAASILHRLAGRSHRVLTAVVVTNGKTAAHAISASQVRFRSVTSREIDQYIATGESMDKAGAYALQGKAGMFVAEIRGSPSGIVGLPLCETGQLLRQFGYPL